MHGEINPYSSQLIEVAGDLRDCGGGVLVRRNANVDSCLEEAKSSHGAAASIGGLKSLPEVFCRRLVLDATADFDVEAQTDAALRLGLLLGPFDDIHPVRAVSSRRRGLNARGALDDDPRSHRLQVRLHQLRPAAVVGAVKDGDERLQAVGHVDSGDRVV